MNAAHFHLLVNHFPIFGLIFGILILISGFLFRQSILKTTAYVIFAVSALGAFLAMRSGDEAEDLAEQLPGVSHQLIHNHEEHAETFFWMTIGLALLSLITLYLQRQGHRLEKAFQVLTLVLALGTAAYSSSVGTSGGEIRHPEIRKGYTLPPTANDEGEERDHKDGVYPDQHDDSDHEH